MEKLPDFIIRGLKMPRKPFGGETSLLLHSDKTVSHVTKAKIFLVFLLRSEQKLYRNHAYSRQSNAIGPIGTNERTYRQAVMSLEASSKLPLQAVSVLYPRLDEFAGPASLADSSPEHAGGHSVEILMPRSSFVGMIRDLRGLNSVQNRTALVALGGNVKREIYAVKLAESQEYRYTTLYLSSGNLTAEHPGIKRLGSRAVIDRSAIDTLSNFTTLLPLLRAAQVSEILCITSQSHARRAGIVGRIVLGVHGIRVNLQVVPEANPGPSEGIWKVFRDSCRAICWAITGWTGESVALWVHPDRVEHVKWRKDAAMRK